MTHCS